MVAAERQMRGQGQALSRMVAGAAGVIVVAFGLWLAFLAPPGGEPMVIAAIPQADPGPAEATGQPMPPMRSSVPPDAALPGEAPLPGDGVARIIDPSTGASALGSMRLVSAPVAELAEATEFGLLPRIAADGRRPSDVYARPMAPLPSGPAAPVKVALIVGGLGISVTGTRDAIERLPAEVTLAFAPYGSNLQTWVDQARRAGHEVVLQIPMEPFDYPDNDPGPHTLLTTLVASDNVERLRWLLGRFTGYFAVGNYMGAKLTSTPDALAPVIDEIAGRGLAYVDDGVSARSLGPDLARKAGTVAAAANISIAADEPRESVVAALADLETMAKEGGLALGVATALPVTVDTIIEWARGLAARGLVLVPASALANRQQG